MSVICITSHDESIYESTKPPVSYKTKAANFSSKFKGHKKHQAKTKNVQGMGVPESDPPDPKEFLRKGQGIKPPQVHVEHIAKVSNMPPIPKRDECIEEQTKKLKHKRKDFINKNIWKATVQKPPPVKPHGIISYLRAPGYGKTPNYLNTIMKNREKYIQSKKDTVGLYQPICKYITRDEREQLLEGLKLNWEELQKHYQGLPILTDTIPKILHKSKLEAELRQLEKDIVLLERHPYIYVYEDDNLTKTK